MSIINLRDSIIKRALLINVRLLKLRENSSGVISSLYQQRWNVSLTCRSFLICLEQLKILLKRKCKFQHVDDSSRICSTTFWISLHLLTIFHRENERHDVEAYCSLNILRRPWFILYERKCHERKRKSERKGAGGERRKCDAYFIVTARYCARRGKMKIKFDWRIYWPPYRACTL